MSNATNNYEKQHNIILEDRKKLILSGVTDVESFEDDAIQLKTSLGDLTIRGVGLKMESFVAEIGDLTVNGNVYAIVYTNDSSKKQSFVSRLFK